jgi:hypothetical protein
LHHSATRDAVTTLLEYGNSAGVTSRLKARERIAHQLWRSWNSSCHAIWMASSFDSLEAAGSPEKPGQTDGDIFEIVPRECRRHIVPQ